MKILVALLLGLTGIGVALLPLLIWAGMLMAASVIPWLLYNHVVAPAFHLSHASFWLIVAGVYLLGILGQLFRR